MTRQDILSAAQTASDMGHPAMISVDTNDEEQFLTTYIALCELCAEGLITRDGAVEDGEDSIARWLVELV